MRTYLATWPNGTFSIVEAPDIKCLFWTLDEEGDPYSAEVSKLPRRFTLTTDKDHPWQVFVEGARRVRFKLPYADFVSSIRPAKGEKKEETK